MIHTNRSFRTRTRTLVCACALGLLSISASAQSNSLPASTIEAISISSSHQTQISDFVSNWTDRALSDSSSDHRKAIEALTKPMYQRGVSIAFRQNYARALNSLMDQLSEKEQIGATLSSIRIAGALATPESVSRIENALDHEDLGVQIFSASRINEVFSSTTRFSSTLTEIELSELIEALDRSASNSDANPELVRACVRALITATTIPSKTMGNTRSSAIITISKIVGAQLRSLSITDDTTFAQSIAIESTSAITTSILDISSETSEQATREAVGLAGDTISISLRQALGNALPNMNDRSMTIQSVQAGESLLYFAWRKHAQSAGKSIVGIKQTNFAELLTQGEDKDFRNTASSLLGPGTPIMREFGFKDTRFLN